jgi:hypothetical protein
VVLEDFAMMTFMGALTSMNSFVKRALEAEREA